MPGAALTLRSRVALAPRGCRTQDGLHQPGGWCWVCGVSCLMMPVICAAGNWDLALARLRMPGPDRA